MLFRVCDLQKEIATFLRQFFDPRWLARLTLLGKDILYAHINAFEVGKAAIVGCAIIIIG